MKETFKRQTSTQCPKNECIDGSGSEENLNYIVIL